MEKTRKNILILGVIVIIIILAMSIISTVPMSTYSEKAVVQREIDSYLQKFPEDEMFNLGCKLEDTGKQIILSCGGTATTFNETHDKISWSSQSSGGGKYSGEFFVPHLNPINKSEDLKLFQEGPEYFFNSGNDTNFCATGVFDYTGKEKIVPYTIMTPSELQFYENPSKERCLSYLTDDIRKSCLECLIMHMSEDSNKEYCNDFSVYPDIYGSCIGNVASFSSNIDICKQETNTAARDGCFYQYAVGHRDVSICSFIDNYDSNQREICINYVKEIVADVGPR